MSLARLLLACLLLAPFLAASQVHAQKREFGPFVVGVGFSILNVEVVASHVPSLFERERGWSLSRRRVGTGGQRISQKAACENRLG